MLVLLSLVHLLHERLALPVILRLAIPACLVAVHISYLLVELPSLKLGRMLTRRRGE
jgi:hypothetical protein